MTGEGGAPKIGDRTATNAAFALADIAAQRSDTVMRVEAMAALAGRTGDEVLEIFRCGTVRLGGLLQQQSEADTRAQYFVARHHSLLEGVQDPRTKAAITVPPAVGISSKKADLREK